MNKLTNLILSIIRDLSGKRVMSHDWHVCKLKMEQDGDEHRQPNHDGGNCQHCKNENIGESQSLWKNIDIDKVSCLNELVHER
jgi:hypothetical protein